MNEQNKEQMEIRIVALLLGEASAFETAEIEEAIQKNAELAAFHAQMRRTIELTREASKQFQATAQPPAEQPKLSAERREALLAKFKEAKVVVAPIADRAHGRRWWLVPASLAAAIIVLLSFITRPRFAMTTALQRIAASDPRHQIDVSESKPGVIRMAERIEPSSQSRAVQERKSFNLKRSG